MCPASTSLLRSRKLIPLNPDRTPAGAVKDLVGPHILPKGRLPGLLLASSCPLAGLLLASPSCWPPGLLLASCWPLAGLFLASCWPLAGTLLASSWLLPGFLLASCWPLAGLLLASCRPLVGFLLASWLLAGFKLPHEDFSRKSVFQRARKTGEFSS